MRLYLGQIRIPKILENACGRQENAANTHTPSKATSINICPLIREISYVKAFFFKNIFVFTLTAGKCSIDSSA